MVDEAFFVGWGDELGAFDGEEDVALCPVPVEVSEAAEGVVGWVFGGV